MTATPVVSSNSGRSQSGYERAESFPVATSECGLRLDHFLTRHFPEHSRSSLNKLIASSDVLVDGQTVKAGYRLRDKETVSVRFPVAREEELLPQEIEFPILFEDEHLLVLSKPPGLVVHPACGHAAGTLVHGLLHHCRNLPVAEGGRPGIVHRLDKDTSGIMLVAKNEFSLRSLMADFKDRRIHKAYHALLLRAPRESKGRIVNPIGRHPVDRKKMAIRPSSGKYAATNWEIIEYFANGWCLVDVGIETGRTHQIRVHMASINSPIAGDGLYGGTVCRQSRIQPQRQMLHASTLSFDHPANGQHLCFSAPLWSDMQQILDALRAC